MNKTFLAYSTTINVLTTLFGLLLVHFGIVAHILVIVFVGVIFTLVACVWTLQDLIMWWRGV